MRPTASAEVDHLVVAAATLEEGVRWCERTLGVTPGPGGRHALMSTHNRLLSIASDAFPNAYFEIIAIDPEAPPPGRARWFGLDEPALQERLLDQGPRLLHLVARTENVEMLRWGLVAQGLDVGRPVAASRETPEGLLQWQIVVRDDGCLLAGGALPTLIQWRGRHPAQAMPDSGVALQSLRLSGLTVAARDVLRLRGVTVETGSRAVGALPPGSITAVLRTPRGEVTLSTF